MRRVLLTLCLLSAACGGTERERPAGTSDGGTSSSTTADAGADPCAACEPWWLSCPRPEEPCDADCWLESNICPLSQTEQRECLEACGGDVRAFDLQVNCETEYRDCRFNSGDRDFCQQGNECSPLNEGS